MEVKGKFRSYTVQIASGLLEPYLIDEKLRTLLVRRDYLRPWQMLAALVSAMNDVTQRDDAWATRVDAKPIMLGNHLITLGGEEWSLHVCSVLLDKNGQHDPATMRAVDVDWDTKVIRVCTRFNLGFGPLNLAEAVAEIFSDRVWGLLDGVGEGLASRQQMDLRKLTPRDEREPENDSQDVGRAA